MKSVVVEASTVAKAIEIAWLKAEKPEEFFIRVLQEHSSGFLGFGAQKAKIVLFFKNSQKSDSQFPVVLKQKEYASFFGNNQLKVPTELHVVDTQLNKNVVFNGHQKKKQQHQQTLVDKNSADKNTKQNQQFDARVRTHQPVAQPKPAIHKQARENFAHTPSHDKKSLVESSLQVQGIKEIKIQSSSFNPQVGKIEKSVQHTPKMKVSLQSTPVASEKIVKEDALKDIAKVLKKVQTQKIIAHVSRSANSTHEKNVVQKNDRLEAKQENDKQNAKQIVRHVHKALPKVAHQKFETYEEFINSTITSAQPEKEVSQVVEKIEKIQPLSKPLEVVISQQAAPLVSQQVSKVEAKAVEISSLAPRVPLKMKRRPLSTEKTGVSGITRSSSLVKNGDDSVDEVAANSTKASASISDLASDLHMLSSNLDKMFSEKTSDEATHVVDAEQDKQ